MSDHPELAVLIMAGGAGTRFWPLSTEQLPKQFLRVFGNRSLLQMTWDRIAGLVSPERVFVLTNRDYCGLTREHLPMIPEENIIGEPCRRDTAAAVALGAYLCKERFGNPVIATLTADHLIEPADEFQKALLSASREAARTQTLYTFGIAPTHPATGYGYLEQGELICEDQGIGHYAVRSFKEKPDAETASQYVASGNYLWNSGMFVWRTDNIISAIERFLPDHARTLSALMNHYRTDKWDSALELAFESLEKVSVDVGIMERAEKVYCVEAQFDWRDAGGWQALTEHLPADENGNFHRGNLTSLDAHSNIIYCDDPHETVMAVGIDDLVVVRAGSRTLIARKDRVEEIKRLTSELNNKHNQ